MAKAYTIHKPTHKFFGINGTPAIAIGQLRGDRLYLNRFECGRLVEKTSVIGSCAYHLTGYGYGVEQAQWDSGDVRKRTYDDMRNAYGFAFGYEVELPIRCEPHLGDGDSSYPIPGDSRYRISKVHRGRRDPDNVVYFCDDAIGWLAYYGDAVRFAKAHHDARQAILRGN